MTTPKQKKQNIAITQFLKDSRINLSQIEREAGIPKGYIQVVLAPSSKNKQLGTTNAKKAMGALLKLAEDIMKLNKANRGDISEDKPKATKHIPGTKTATINLSEIPNWESGAETIIAHMEAKGANVLVNDLGMGKEYQLAQIAECFDMLLVYA